MHSFLSSIRGPESETMTSFVWLWHIVGGMGVGLTLFSDVLIANTYTRILVLSILLIIPATAILLFLLGRRLASNAGASIGVSMIVAIISYLSVRLEILTEWTGLFDKDQMVLSIVIMSVVSYVIAVTVACYLDSLLSQQHVSLIMIVSGVAFCMIAAVLDYPSLMIVFEEAVLFLSCLILRKSEGMLRSIGSRASRAATTVTTGDVIAEEMRSISASSPTKRMMPSVVEEVTSEHPLISKGLIVNPKTHRTVKIGGKKYTELVSLGYVPDLVSGTLIKDGEI